MKIVFPVYRKYADNKTYFMVKNYHEMEELKIIGKRFLLTQMVVKIHPDRVLINDIINMNSPFILPCNFDEFKQILDDCKLNKTPINQF